VQPAEHLQNLPHVHLAIRHGPHLLGADHGRRWSREWTGRRAQTRSGSCSRENPQSPWVMLVRKPPTGWVILVGNDTLLHQRGGGGHSRDSARSAPPIRHRPAQPAEPAVAGKGARRRDWRLSRCAMAPRR
jgi:hypothetical protein